MRILIFAIVFIITTSSLFSQRNYLNSNLDRNLQVSISPFYLQYRGLKLNFEKKDTSNTTSYSFSPIFYYGEIQDNELFHRMDHPDRADITGGGLEAAYRYYVFKDIGIEEISVFIGLQSSYNYVVLNGRKEVFVDDIIDDLDVKVIDEVESSISVQKFNVNAILGGVWVFDNYFSLSGELQYGLNFSSANEQFLPLNDFDSNFFMINGNTLYIDIKLGVWINSFF